MLVLCTDKPKTRAFSFDLLPSRLLVLDDGSVLDVERRRLNVVEIGWNAPHDEVVQVVVHRCALLADAGVGLAHLLVAVVNWQLHHERRSSDIVNQGVWRLALSKDVFR